MQTRASPQNPEDSQKHNPDWLICSLPLLSQDAARLWMFVWPPPMQQLAETQRKQPSTLKFHIIGTKFQTFGFKVSSTARLSGEHSCHRTLQCAADIASSYNGQHMSAKSLQHRWKHEIKMALLKAAMTRAVYSNPSTRAEWLLAGIMDRAVNHLARAPPLDGGHDDGDADTGIDTVIPDDDATIHITAAFKLLCRVRSPPWGSLLSLMYQCGLELEILFEDQGVCSEVITCSLSLERAIYER